MNMVDIINHKRLGYELTREEISFAFTAYLEGEIPDYQKIGRASCRERV